MEQHKPEARKPDCRRKCSLSRQSPKDCTGATPADMETPRLQLTDGAWTWSLSAKNQISLCDVTMRETRP